MVSRILNNPGLAFLAAESELNEIEAIGLKIKRSRPISVQKKGIVKLQRTFNLKFNDQVIRYWRVVGPADHRNYQSDLSLDGLKEWEII